MDVLPPFPEFEGRLRELLAENRFLEIINLIEDRGSHYPEHYLLLKYWQVGMAAREKNESLAVQYLDDLIEERLWISQYLLRSSPSLEGLQDSVEFEKRVNDMAELQRSEQRQLLPLLSLRQENLGDVPEKGAPLLIGLHAGGGTALTSLKFWQPAARKGWLVAAPQSSQALWSGAYVWEDHQIVEDEIRRHRAEMAAKYKVDTERFILAGHGSGGEVAAWLTLKNRVDAGGFIAVAPEGSLIYDPDYWFREVRALEGRQVRGVILAGSEQGENIAVLKRLADLLSALNVPTLFEILPFPAHVFSEEINQPMENAIDFLLS